MWWLFRLGEVNILEIEFGYVDNNKFKVFFDVGFVGILICWVSE